MKPSDDDLNRALLPLLISENDFLEKLGWEIRRVLTWDRQDWGDAEWANVLQDIGAIVPGPGEEIKMKNHSFYRARSPRNASPFRLFVLSLLHGETAVMASPWYKNIFSRTPLRRQHSMLGRVRQIPLPKDLKWPQVDLKKVKRILSIIHIAGANVEEPSSKKRKRTSQAFSSMPIKQEHEIKQEHASPQSLFPAVTGIDSATMLNPRSSTNATIDKHREDLQNSTRKLRTEVERLRSAHRDLSQQAQSLGSVNTELRNELAQQKEEKANLVKKVADLEADKRNWRLKLGGVQRGIGDIQHKLSLLQDHC